MKLTCSESLQSQKHIIVKHQQLLHIAILESNNLSVVLNRDNSRLRKATTLFTSKLFVLPYISACTLAMCFLSQCMLMMHYGLTKYEN